uniref:Uncharacterized protein n=1 Tax=viral metagenome TaxID=1070528 RepID=A0A6M3IE64_9ZZZZ
MTKYKIGDRVQYKDGDKGIIVNSRQEEASKYKFQAARLAIYGGDLWRVYNASKDKLENWHESYFSLEKLEG